MNQLCSTITVLYAVV